MSPGRRNCCGFIPIPTPDGVPVEMMSPGTNAMKRDIAKGLDAGFFRYLTKPIKVGEFMETMDHAFETSKARRLNRRENAS